MPDAPTTVDTASTTASTETASTSTQHTVATPAAATGSEGAPATTESTAMNTAPQFAVPESYKDKPWASKIKTPDDLWKQLENAQTLIGRRNPVPNFDTATPQEIEEFLGQMRPTDAKAYDFSGGEEGYTPSELDPAFAEALHKAGLPPKIANGLIKDLRGVITSAGEKAYDPQGFLDEMERTFGNGYEVKVNQTRQLVESNLSATDKAVMENMPNSQLAVVFRLAANLNKAYGARESGLGGEHKAGGDAGKTVDETRRDLRKQISDLDRRPHDASEKTALIERLNKTYQPQTAKR